jgi:hypothetical protein
MRRFILPIFLIATFSAPCLAQVQPGSTGGTIGKQDKSISGGEEADRPRAAPHPKRSAGPQQTSSSNTCALVGTWSWYRGLTEMTFLPGGTMRSSVGPVGSTWTCTGKRTARSIASGNKEQYAIAEDGKSMFVTSTWGGGIAFTATRRDQD